MPTLEAKVSTERLNAMFLENLARASETPSSFMPYLEENEMEREYFLIFFIRNFPLAIPPHLYILYNPKDPYPSLV